MRLSSAFWYTFASRELMLVISFANAIVVARALGPTKYGAFALAVAVAAFLSTLVSMGLPWSNRVLAARDPASSGRLFLLSTAFIVWYIPAAAALGWGAPGVLSWIAGPFRSSHVVYVLLGTGILALFNNVQSILLGQERYRLYNLLAALPALGMGMTNVGLFLVGWIRLDLVLQLWISWTLLGAVASVGAVLARSSGGVRPDGALFREAHSIGFRALLCALFGYGTQRGNHALLNRLASGSAVGLYHASMTIASVIGHAASAVGVVVTNRASADKTRPQDLMRLLRLHLLLGGVAAAALFAVAPWLIPLLFGAAYTPSVQTVRIMLVGAYAYGLFGIASSYISGRHGFPKVLVGLVALQSILTVGLAFALIPGSKLAGAAWAYSTACVVGAGLMLHVLFRDVGEPWSNLIPRTEDVRMLWRRVRGA